LTTIVPRIDLSFGILQATDHVRESLMIGASASAKRIRLTFVELASFRPVPSAAESCQHRFELRNGRCMDNHGRTIATASIRTLAALAACRNSLGSRSGAGPLGVWRSSSCYWPSSCRLARILIARRPVPPLPRRARTFHQRAERVFSSRGPATAWTPLVLVTHQCRHRQDHRVGCEPHTRR